MTMNIEYVLDDPDAFQGMECLDISFNPINQDSITRLAETSQDKIKAVLFSKEQIQSPAHRVTNFLTVVCKSDSM